MHLMPLTEGGASSLGLSEHSGPQRLWHPLLQRPLTEAEEDEELETDELLAVQLQRMQL